MIALPQRFDPQWIRKYASRAATLKNCQQSDGSPPEVLLATIETAFKRVYRAVAFDIDGTLTTENTSDVDPRAAEAIGALLQRGVHVFLVTGRGHSSTRKAALFIKENARLTDWYLRRLACVVLNGVVLITTNSESPDRFLEEEQLLAPEITCLPELLKSVAEALAARAPDAAHVEQKPNSLRIVIHDNDRTELVRTIITDCLNSFESPASRLHLSIGKYAITRSFSVASTNKRLALASIAAKYGISPDHILRIGDQGHEGGNDFELLDSPAGFSVGTVSESHGGCIPVLDESLNTILQAAPATRRLTSMLNLFPSISMSPAWTERHTRTLLTFEKLALQRSREENETVTQRLRVRLRYLIGPASNHGPTTQLRIEDIFDPLSGAVRFRDWEFAELPQDHPAASFFRKKLPNRASARAPNLAWSMFSDTGRLLRGPHYYYALSRPDRPASLSDYQPVLSSLLESAIASTQALETDDPSLPFFKLLLAFADNLRNALITLQYACFLADLRESPTPSFQLTRLLYSKVLLPHTRQHFNLLLNPDWTWRGGLVTYRECLSELRPQLSSVLEVLVGLLGQPAGDEEVIRRWRESDHFLQNVTAIQLGLHEFQQRGDLGKDGAIMCGVVYGGTELPAIAQVVGEARGLSVSAALAKLSLYGQKEHGEKVRRGDVAYVEEFLLKENRLCTMDGSSFGRKISLLLDDNLTTGATLQLARDLVVVSGGDVGGAIVVGFPGSNRIAQMAMDGHGFVDSDLLFGFVRGLISPSPYARLLFPGDSDNPYLDQTKVFNKARTRIERYLRKNEAER